jgi:hypothetical protein
MLWQKTWYGNLIRNFYLNYSKLNPALGVLPICMYFFQLRCQVAVYAQQVRVEELDSICCSLLGCILKRIVALERMQSINQSRKESKSLPF